MRSWLVYALLAPSLWGTTPIVVKFLVESLNPIPIVLYRLIFATLLFAVLLATFRKIKATQRVVLSGELPKFLVLALAGVTLFTSFFFFSIELTTASKANLIQNASPAIIVPLAALLLKERLRLKPVIGVILGFIGVASVVYGGQNPTEIISTGSFIGDMSAFAAGFSWALFTVLWRKWIRNQDSYISMGIVFFLGTLLVLPLAAYNNELLVGFDLPMLAFLVYLGAFTAAIPYFIWTRAVDIVGPSKVGPFLFISPLVTVVLSIYFLNETVNFGFILGFILITLSIILSLKQ